jgi:hypothetical protein
MYEGEVFEKNGIKIVYENHRLIFEKNGEKTESEKEYYDFIDIKVNDDGKIFVLDTELSVIDVYDEKMKLSETIGKRQYVKDFLHECLYKFYLGSDLFELLIKPVFFYPRSFIVKKNFIYVWDTRNFRILKIGKDGKVYGVKELGLNVKEVYLDDNAIKVDNAVFDYDKDFFELKKDNMKEILRNFYGITGEKPEEITEFTSVKVKEYAEFRKNYNVYDVCINGKKVLEPEGFIELKDSCFPICFNGEDEFLAVDNSPSRKTKIFFFKGREIKGINDNDFFGKITDIVYKDGYYYLMDNSKNKIFVMKNDLKIDREIELTRFNGKGTRHITFDKEGNICISVLAEKCYFKINKNALDDRDSEVFENKIWPMYDGKNEIYFDIEKGPRYPVLYVNDEKVYEFDIVYKPIILSEDKMLFHEYAKKNIKIMNLEEKKIVEEGYIFPEIKNAFFYGGKNKAFGYVTEKGIAYIYDFTEI